MSNAQLYRLANPKEYFWMNMPPEIEVINNVDQICCTKQQLIFVHGMEFHHVDEVLKDLVFHFEQSAELFDWDLDHKFEVLFVYWNSKLAPELNSPMYPLRQFVKNAKTIGKRSLNWPAFYTDLEKRAINGATSLAPILEDIFNDSRSKPPLVITHSMGGLFWAEVIRQARIAAKVKIGSWWNLQPALKWNAFNASQPYESVLKIYESQGDKLSIWYSLFDVVLGVLFLGCHKTLAMGQIGAPRRLGISHQDVSLLALETHGQTSFFKPSSNFMKKIKPRIYQQIRLMVPHTTGEI